MPIFELCFRVVREVGLGNIVEVSIEPVLLRPATLHDLSVMLTKHKISADVLLVRHLIAGPELTTCDRSSHNKSFQTILCEFIFFLK